MITGFDVKRQMCFCRYNPPEHAVITVGLGRTTVHFMVMYGYIGVARVALEKRCAEATKGGPAERPGMKHGLKVVMIAEHAGPVRSAQGVLVRADYGFADAPPLDIMMVPGGSGTRTELKNPVFLDYLRAQDRHTQLTTSVCSGSALLARAGLLKGHRAKTNKLYFSLATSQDTSVD